MLSRSHTVWIATSLLVAGGGASLVVRTTPAPRLEAMPAQAWTDTDGDFLPDALEWVLLTDANNPDTDDDGVGDFLEAAQRTLPTDSVHPPLDNEVRAVVTVQGTGTHARTWLHLLFRFVAHDTTALTSLTPYLDWWGYRFPLDDLLGLGQTDVDLRDAGADGLFVRVSLELCSEHDLRAVMPCTIGAIAQIGGRTISTGAYLRDSDGFSTSLVGIEPSAGAVQTLTQGAQGTPFWSGQRVCLMRLAIVGTSPGGAMAEVVSSTCISDGRLACPPTCTSATGQLMFFPDGLSTVTGGGVPPR